MLHATLTTLTTEHLPLNRLICAGCRSSTSVSEYPFRPNGLHCVTCVYCQWRKQKKPLQEQPPQQPLQQSLEQPSQYTSPRYCSSCNQPRQPSQFGRFKTCEICRATNRKALYRRFQRELQRYPRPPLLQLAHAHLEEWVKDSGEEEVHGKWISGRWWPHPDYKRRLLTVEEGKPMELSQSLLLGQFLGGGCRVCRH